MTITLGSATLLVLGHLAIDEVWHLEAPITDPDAWVRASGSTTELGGLVGHAIREDHTRSGPAVVQVAGFAGREVAELLRQGPYRVSLDLLNVTGRSRGCLCLQAPDGARFMTSTAPGPHIGPPDISPTEIIDRTSPTAVLTTDRVSAPALRAWVSECARVAQSRGIPVLAESNAGTDAVDFVPDIVMGRPDGVPADTQRAVVHDGEQSVTVRDGHSTRCWERLVFPTVEPGVGRGDRFGTGVAMRVAAGFSLGDAVQDVLEARSATWATAADA